MKLDYKKDMALVSYEDSLKHFKEDSVEVSEAQKRLYEAKLSLDNQIYRATKLSAIMKKRIDLKNRS